jgi:addiction module HigA family antidote
MTQSDLARRMGRPVKTINEIVNAKTAITPDTAIQLELTLGIAASLWTNLEAAYREHLARQRSEAELGAYTDWAAAFPINDLVRHKLLDEAPTRASGVANLLRYFAVSNPEVWERQWLAPAASFRPSPTYKTSPHAAAAWLRWGELLAATIETATFDSGRLLEVLDEARPLSRVDVALTRERLQAMFASAGVALVIAPELKGVRLSGAARWMSAEKALIQLSTRHKTDDQFWFSLYHEARHLLQRGRLDYLDDADPPKGDHDDERAAAEHDANEFARNTLIDANAYADFLATEDLSADAIRRFAKDLSVAPGIVVGRLQYDKKIPRSYYRELKKPIDFALT